MRLSLKFAVALKKKNILYSLFYSEQHNYDFNETLLSKYPTP